MAFNIGFYAYAFSRVHTRQGNLNFFKVREFVLCQGKMNVFKNVGEFYKISSFYQMMRNRK